MAVDHRLPRQDRREPAEGHGRLTGPADIAFRPLRAADLADVLPWFDVAATQTWLGGPDWPTALLGLAAADDKRHALLVVHDRLPVGLLDIEVHADGRAGLANVTAPQARRRGFAAAAISALPSMPALSATREFFAGVEQGNLASERLLLGIGFRRVTEIDADGFRYFAWPQPGYPSPRRWRLAMD